MTCTAPVTISQPVAPKKPPITGKGTNRIARPARVKPSMQSSTPVIAVASAIAISVGTRRSVVRPSAARRWIMAATSAAMMAEVPLSGPATANGSELRSATTAAATVADMNVSATP